MFRFRWAVSRVSEHYWYVFAFCMHIKCGIKQILINLLFLFVFSIPQVHSKFTLAFGGILIVVSSVVCSLGALGYVHLPTTMLTIEVIPFLILAVGVDNLFILVHAFQRLDVKQYSSSSEAVADALGEVGPSILLTAISQVCCFGIGALNEMPAVRTFALYATVAILFNFLLQITAFVALMTIDRIRHNVCSNYFEFLFQQFSWKS